MVAFDTVGAFQAYFASYRRQNLGTKEINQSSCEQGVGWAWQTFGECLLSPAHMAGYVIGVMSLPCWLIGYILLCTQVYLISIRCFWALIVATFVVDIISFVGAVMSMQMILLIWCDIFAVLVEACLMLVVAVVVLTRRSAKREPMYSRVCDLQNGPVVTPPWNQNLFGMASYRVCFLPLCLATTLLIVMVFATISKDQINIRLKSANMESKTEMEHTVILTTFGYLVGSFACFARWGVEVAFLRFGARFLQGGGTSRIWKGGGTTLITADICFVIGILLQSGGIMVTIVALPWLVGRLLRSSFQIFKLNPTKWSKLCTLDDDDIETVDDDNVDDDNIIEFEDVNLLGSSDSEMSDVHVLWDRSWKIPGKPEVHVHCDDTPSRRSRSSSVPRQRTMVTPHEVTTTTDSDWTSTSQEQELEWDNEEPASMSQYHPSGTSLRRPRLSLTSQVATLDLTSSETYDQRVRTWITQSTPEEEMPPSLALTLNLDTGHEAENNKLKSDLEDRKINFSLLPLGPRKNSF